jgi:asparagine synthase (glutamine-hydrolysing)
MLGLITHRGPDGEGTHFTTSGLAMGMRRLSIIDLAGGWQPVWNEDETVGIVFNGEIYNYVELRDELVSRGHSFRTHSDTEVLLHLYEELGAKMFDRLRGMFAFAIYDSRQNKLLVARDHFGQKPLYYHAGPAGFAFASELKCLLSLPWVPRDFCPDAFADYVSWLSLPAPRTHFRGIQKLSAGSFVEVSLDAPHLAVPQKYWTYDLHRAPDLNDLDTAVEALDRVLTDSVRMHLRADVPVGVLLSSGLDSRTVVAYAQELQEGKMQTFTVGFGDQDSEIIGAAQTAREIRSQHHQLELTPRDFSESIGRIAHHLDEPVGDPACFAVLKVCELARQHVKVLLSGEGSDELFGGYEGRYSGILTTMEKSARLRLLGPLLPHPRSHASASRWQRFLSRAKSTPASEVLALRLEGLPGDIRNPRGLTASQLANLQERIGALSGNFRPQRDLLSSLLAFDLDWQLAESLLQKADKMSMGASIELRTPLLDREVAEVAARIPSSLKLPPGGPGKFVLRKTLGRKLNEPMTRPKKGFPVPLNDWFAGPLRDQIESTLFADSSTICAQLDRALLRAAWDDLVAGRWDGGRIIYSLWLYEVWRGTLAA